jgi:NitT/TauT family transport system permease protein
VVARASGWQRFLHAFYPPLTALLALLGVWQFAYSLAWKPDYVLPSPSSVWVQFTSMVPTGRRSR